MLIFQHIPAIVRVIMVFILVLICIRKRLSLGNAFILGTIFLSVLFGIKPLAMLESMVASVLDLKTLSIAFIVSLILILSNNMELAGQMERLLEKFQGLVSNPKLNLIIFPALIGLLPMPGGAVFSAPMVKKLGKTSKLSSDQLSFINYWFRHIWEYWWPVYPGVLLTTILADINILSIMLFMCPLTIITVCLGYMTLKSSVKFQEEGKSSKRSSLLPFLKELLPIIIVIIPGLGMGVIFSLAFPTLIISKEIGLILALCMAIGWVWYENNISKERIWQTLSNPWLLKMGYMIISIMIFKGILEDSNAAAFISRELVLLQVPLVLITVLLPFLVGMSTGIVIAFVGSTLPILIPLINSFGEANFIPAYVMLVLTCGYAGVLLSPIHLCLLLSNEYFGATTGSVYRHLLLPCIFLVCISIIYFWVLRWLISLHFL